MASREQDVPGIGEEDDPVKTLVSRALGLLKLLGMGGEGGSQPSSLPPTQARRPENQAPDFMELLNSPFVQDTLRSALGGVDPRFVQEEPSQAALGAASGQGILGFVDRQTPNKVSLTDRLAELDPRRQESTVAHEMFHTADLQGRLPAELGGASRAKKFLESSAKKESQAYSFEIALDMFRHGYTPTDLKEVERVSPESLKMLRFLEQVFRRAQ